MNKNILLCEKFVWDWSQKSQCLDSSNQHFFSYDSQTGLVLVGEVIDEDVNRIKTGQDHYVTLIHE